MSPDGWMRLKVRIHRVRSRRYHHEYATETTSPVVVCPARIAAARGVSRGGTSGTRLAARTREEGREGGDCPKSAKSRCREQREHERSAAWPFAKSNVKSHVQTSASRMTRCSNMGWEIGTCSKT